mgnify:CR=1 FL=1
MKTLIKNGRVVDPSQNIDAVLDILFNNALEYELQIPEKDRSIQIILYSDFSHSSFSLPRCRKGG